jgi:hypothetical protein
MSVDCLFRGRDPGRQVLLWLASPSHSTQILVVAHSIRWALCHSEQYCCEKAGEHIVVSSHRHRHRYRLTLPQYGDYQVIGY